MVMAAGECQERQAGLLHFDIINTPSVHHIPRQRICIPISPALDSTIITLIAFDDSISNEPGVPGLFKNVPLTL